MNFELRGPHALQEKSQALTRASCLFITGPYFDIQDDHNYVDARARNSRRQKTKRRRSKDSAPGGPKPPPAEPWTRPYDLPPQVRLTPQPPHDPRTHPTGVGLVGRTLGILGMGSIGAEVFRLAKPFVSPTLHPHALSATTAW